MSFEQLPLKGKTAIVTGASRGLGAGMAYELAKRGADVVITYTSPSSQPLITTLQDKIAHLPHNPHTHTIKTDLSLLSAPTEIITSLKTWRPALKIDILINNAGTEGISTLGSITPDHFSKVYDLNVRGPLLLTQAILPYLPAKGRIINISSVASRAGFAGLGLYSSSKAALEALTRTWARELGGNGTTVNAVNPGPVETDMLSNVPEKIKERQKEETPVENRFGSVEEVANVVAWLAGSDASWITGQVIAANGGWAMY